MRGGNNFKHKLVPNIVVRRLMKGEIVNDEDSDLIITMHGHWRGR